MPRNSINLDSANQVAHGVLMLGGSFTDVNNFDPTIMSILFEDSSEVTSEGRFDLQQWYLRQNASINRIRTTDGLYKQRLVVTPGQFKATTNLNQGPATKGIMRLYDELDLVVYSSPTNEFDYTAPSVWQVSATPGASRSLAFRVVVEDRSLDSFVDASGVMRVVVLYRNLNTNQWSRVDLDYNDATNVASKTIVVPTAGNYEYFVQAVDMAGNVSLVLEHGDYYQTTVTNSPPPTADDRSIFLTAQDAGSAGSVGFDENDIVVFDPQTDAWTLYFDGTDVGFNRGVSAFALLDNGDILLTPNRRVNLNGLGWIEEQDIVRFTPVSVGPVTTGSFAWFFDGSDVGLDRDQERIVSLGLSPDGRLVISTFGNAAVSKAGGGTLRSKYWDLLIFNANELGDATEGGFELYLDGASVGIEPNRIFSSWIDADNGDIYFSLRSDQVIDGVAYDDNDIIVCDPAGLGASSECAFALYWDGAANGFGNNKINGMELGAGLPVIQPKGSITIVKAVNGSGNNIPFNFTGDLGNFTLELPGQSSQVFPNLSTGAYQVSEVVPAGWDVQSILCAGDADGGTVVANADTVVIDLDAGETITCTFTNAPEGTVSGDARYVSPRQRGTTSDGVRYGDDDILRYQSGSWSMFIDGSDVGVKKLNSFTFLPDETVLMTFTRNTNLPGLGSVKPSDIVRFIPTSIGDNTAGSFELYFDGSDVELTKNAEAIDAMAFDAEGNLILSTRGNANVGGASGSIKAADEDLLKFEITSVGDSTSGTWSLYFDGSDVGLVKEDIDALWIDTTNDELYLSVMNDFNTGSVSGDANTIFVCTPLSLGPNTSCSFRTEWDTDGDGLSADVDGLFLVR